MNAVRKQPAQEAVAMLSKGRITSRSPKGNLYGFITDWNVLILGSDGSTLKSNIPGQRTYSEIAFGDMDREGSDLSNAFEESEISDFMNAASTYERASALGKLFGACANNGNTYIVGEDTNSVTKYANEWQTRQSRLIKARVPGIDVDLTLGSREILTMVAFERHPRMDIAAYCEGVTYSAWKGKFEFPDDFLHDGHIGLMRSYADMDANALGDFVDSYGDDIKNSFDCKVGRELIKRFG